MGAPAGLEHLRLRARRIWGGLDVALVDTPMGATRVPASSNHRFTVHVGTPVRAICQCDGRTHSRLQSRGDIDLVPAGLPGVWEDDRATSLLRVSVSPALLGAAAAGLGLDPDRIALTPRFQLRDPQLEHLAWALEAELEAPAASDALYGETLAMGLAVHLVRRYRLETGARLEREDARGLSRPQRERVVDYIEAHLARSLTLAELAAVAGVSVSHFKGLFKRSTGLSVHQYVVRRRVERARVLLGRERATIARVALETGFADPSHMARWMRRLLGVTPAGVLRGD
ncbi:helix-turn-helix domain-containing protein [Pendulispora albinea]|uniref:AraC family transcriptional regulator n=1 Tax=Pendulispora albinea TaxID=2741071 RepID=A0ABZ2LNZ9_9BACT